jgi:hypothetical protein
MMAYLEVDDDDNDIHSNCMYIYLPLLFQVDIF